MKSKKLFDIFMEQVDSDPKFHNTIGMETLARILQDSFGGRLVMTHHGLEYVNEQSNYLHSLRAYLEHHQRKNIIAKFFYWIGAMKQYPEIGNN